ncbi:hypothetical protein, partial [Streptomyces coeruleorubidus]
LTEGAKVISFTAVDPAVDAAFTQTFEGSLGLSVDSTVPVYDTAGKTIVGFVSAGTRRGAAMCRRNRWVD